MDRGSWRATVHVVAESDMTEHAHTQLHQSVSRSVVSNSFATQWTIAHQAPLSMGFSRQEYWRGLPCPPPGGLPLPNIKPASPALAGGLFTTRAVCGVQCVYLKWFVCSQEGRAVCSVLFPPPRRVPGTSKSLLSSY